MEVRLLGPLEVLDATGAPLPPGGPKERALLAVLARHTTHPVSEDRLVHALCDADPPRTAAGTLQS